MTTGSCDRWPLALSVKFPQGPGGCLIPSPKLQQTSFPDSDVLLALFFPPQTKTFFIQLWHPAITVSCSSHFQGCTQKVPLDSYSAISSEPRLHYCQSFHLIGASLPPSPIPAARHSCFLPAPLKSLLPVPALATIRLPHSQAYYKAPQRQCLKITQHANTGSFSETLNVQVQHALPLLK